MMKRSLFLSTILALYWNELSTITITRRTTVTASIINNRVNNRHHHLHHCTIRRLSNSIVKMTSLNVATSSASNNNNNDNNNSDDVDDKKTIKVVVIGAGFAGLSVAYHLLSLFGNDINNNRNGGSNNKKHNDKHLLDIQIIEARNRIGGRVYPYTLDSSSKTTTTTPKTTTKIDLGGQWLHEASVNNPIRQLMEHDLKLQFVNKKLDKRKRKNVIFDYTSSLSSNDQNSHQTTTATTTATTAAAGAPLLFDEGILQRVRTLFYKALEEYEYDDPKITSQTSLEDLLQSRLELQQLTDTRYKKLVTENPDAIQRVLNYLIHKTEGYEGGKMKELSALLADLYVNIGGPDVTPEGTYDTVLQAIRRRIVSLVDDDKGNINTCRIRLNTIVTKIEYNPSNDHHHDNDGDNNTNRKQQQICITTVPPNNDNKNISLTDYEKMYCDYCVCTVPLGVLKQKKIIFDPPLSTTAITKQDAINKIGMGLLNKIVFKFPFCFWNDLKQFGLAHDDITKVKMYYDCSHDINEEAVLIQYLSGQAAERVERIDDNGNVKIGLTDEEAIDESLEALRYIFGHDNVPTPLETKVTRWKEDPYAFGSYSFTKVGCTAKMYDDIASPIGNLMFAGEHTSKHGHSTVHGAWGTGKREAERIYNMIALKDSQRSQQQQQQQQQQVPQSQQQSM